MEEQYAGNLSANEIEQSYNGGEIVPIYTSDQLEKVGSGETVYVAEAGKIYTFTDDKSYLFYGQSEDLTDILNELIDKKISQSEVGSSTGKSTLLWENELESGSGIMSYEITVENLNKYKYLYMENYFYDDDTQRWEVSAVGTLFIPTQILIENSDVYHGVSKYECLRYVERDNLSINMEKSYSSRTKMKLYGIE